MDDPKDRHFQRAPSDRNMLYDEDTRRDLNFDLDSKLDDTLG